MPTLTLHAARRGFRLHQRNWGAALIHNWRLWHFRWARHRQRKVLRDLDAHLLADIGVTREQALEEAGKSLFELSDVYVHSI
jgi:uncharacterized protein YjiS (DUF1127 family)